VTIGPSSSRSVTAAAAASVIHGSATARTGERQCRWSQTKKPCQPASSASTASRTTTAGSASSSNRGSHNAERMGTTLGSLGGSRECRLVCRTWVPLRPISTSPSTAAVGSARRSRPVSGRRCAAAAWPPGRACRRRGRWPRTSASPGGSWWRPTTSWPPRGTCPPGRARGPW
jgi:hypothetical protein